MHTISLALRAPGPIDDSDDPSHPTWPIRRHRWPFQTARSTSKMVENYTRWAGALAIPSCSRGRRHPPCSGHMALLPHPPLCRRVMACLDDPGSGRGGMAGAGAGPGGKEDRDTHFESRGRLLLRCGIWISWCFGRTGSM